MSDVLDGASSVPTFPLPDDYLARFRASAGKDGLIEGKTPVEFLQSQAQDTQSKLAEVATDLGLVTGAVVAGNLAIGILNPLAPLTGPFMIGALIDGTRLITVTLVNNLESPLQFTSDDVHLGTGHVEAVPAVLDENAKITQSNHVLGRGDVMGVDGAGLGIFVFQKTTTLGVGFYGTEGAIHLKALDSTKLPDGLYLGWRVPERGKNTCAISVNAYRDAQRFYDRWVNDGSARQTDGSTNDTAGIVAHCAISSITDTVISMVATVEPKTTTGG